MNRRNFIKTGALFVPATFGIFVPKVSAQSYLPHRRKAFSGWTPASIPNLVYWGNANTPSSPVATWVDSSGNGRDMAQADSAKQPTVVTSAYGANSAVRFDGSNDTIAGPACNALGITQEFTFAAWYRYTSTAGSQTLVSAWNTGGSPGSNCFTAFSTGTTVLDFLIEEDDNGVVTSTGNPSLSTSTWYHFAFVCDAMNLRMFKDGAALGTTPAHDGTLNTSSGTTLFRFGFLSPATGVYFFNGDIAAPVLYSRALSAGEIVTLMNGTPP